MPVRYAIYLAQGDCRDLSMTMTFLQRCRSASPGRNQASPLGALTISTTSFTGISPVMLRQRRSEHVENCFCLLCFFVSFPLWFYCRSPIIMRSFTCFQRTKRSKYAVLLTQFGQILRADRDAGSVLFDISTIFKKTFNRIVRLLLFCRL